MPLRPAILLALLAWEGCDLLAYPREHRFVGIFEWAAGEADAAWSGDALPLAAPDTVRAGEPFTAVVTTIGPNGCWRAAEASAQAGDRSVLLTAYDAFPGRKGVTCPQEIVALRHSVTLRLDEPGVWTLRARGRRVVAGRFEEAPLIVVERSVVVL